MTVRERAASPLTAVISGLDAALIVTVLGIMYALIAYAPLGPAALPAALLATTMAILVGGGATVLAARDASTVHGPTASGALVIASMVADLQNIPGARGHVDVALVGTAFVVLIAGGALCVFARLRIGSALKFVPFPVLLGFANTVALLLIVSMIPSALGHAYAGRLTQAATWFHGWSPVALLVAACGTSAGWLVLRQRRRMPAAIVALVVATAVHYALSAGCEACTPGPLLDLETDSTLSIPSPSRLPIAIMLGMPFWSAVLQAALVLAVLNALFSLLAAAQLARPLDPPVDGNRLLRSLGIGNLASGLALGLPVAVVASTTRAIQRAAGRPALATGVYLLAAAAVFGLAHRWFEYLPMAAIASAVFVAARGLFDPSPWPLLMQLRGGREARRAAIGPVAVTALVVVVGLAKGLAASLFIGALAAACLLAVEMRRGVVIAIDDLRTRRSRRIRPAAENSALDALGEQVRILTLGHWLYFGTADELGDLLEHQSTARWLVLDLRRVAGVDLTAARSLVNAASRLGHRGVHLVVAGLPEGDARRRAIELFRADDGQLPLALVASLDEALEQAEESLIGDRADPADPHAFALPGLGADEARHVERHVERIAVASGTVLFRAGDPGDAFYIVRSGRLTLRLLHGGTQKRLLTFGSGGIFGELAMLDGRTRSAEAVADADSTLWMFTRERFDALAREDPALHGRVLTGLALHLTQRLRDTTRLLDLD